MTKIHKFLTGSSYHGRRDSDWNGTGVYYFPDGSEYHGNMKNGSFSGEGVLITPSKFAIRGRFKDDDCVAISSLYFSDNLEYTEQNWKYCTEVDRRYKAEIDNPIPAVGMGYENSTKPTRQIPENYYDVGDGYFDPSSGAVFVHDENNQLQYVRTLSTEQAEWVKKYCRNTHTDPTGVLEEINELNTRDMIAVNQQIDADCNCVDCVCTLDLPGHFKDAGSEYSMSVKSTKSISSTALSSTYSSTGTRSESSCVDSDCD